MKFFAVPAMVGILLSTSIFAQTYGDIDLISTNTTIDGLAFANDFAVPPDPTGPVIFDQQDCIGINNVPLIGGNAIKALPTSDQSLYCLLRAVESDICASTSAITATGFEVGGTGSEMIIQWQVFAKNQHLTELNVPYAANTNVDADFTATIEIDAANIPISGQNILYYEYTVWLAAFSQEEVPGDDSADITADLDLGGVDLLDAGNFPKAFSAPPGVGQGRQLRLSGWINFTPNVPFDLVIDGDADVSISDPGIITEVPGSICGARWYDVASASYFGNLRLSLSSLPPSAPPVGAQPSASLFSVDIGSSRELSDPLNPADGIFDPGDMYKVVSPTFPAGGGDGLVDDGTYLALDPNPSTPDVIPPITAAPVASGLPPLSISNSYYDLDGFDRLAFTPVGLSDGDDPTPIPLGGGCLNRPDHLYISFDDDSPPHYVAGGGSAPVNSTGDPIGSVIFGANSDEVIEVFTAGPIFGGVGGGTPMASETNLHPQLAPNPPPIGPSGDNDDVDALNFDYNPGCNQIFLSVDHEATGLDAGGLPHIPSTIYRTSNIPGGGLIPTITAAHLGIPAEADVDAFEFISAYDPNILPNSYYTALLFSVDTDDPLTAGVDESGGLSPAALYISPLNGTHSLFDQDFVFNYDIDALTSLPLSYTGSTNPQTCIPLNFTNQPVNLTANVGTNDVTLNWTPYPFATGCVLSGNKTSATNDANIVLGGLQGQAPNSYALALSQLQPNTTYRIRLRCGCNANTLSPYTPYLFFTTPSSPGPAPIADIFASENTDDMESRLKVYPNPADDFVVVTSEAAYSGKTTLSLFNALGQMIYEQLIDTSLLKSGLRLETENLSSGWYTLQIVNDGIMDETTFFITTR